MVEALNAFYINQENVRKRMFSSLVTTWLMDSEIFQSTNVQNSQQAGSSRQPSFDYLISANLRDQLQPADS